MRPILFELGPLTVSSFGVTMSLAFIVAGIVMQRDFTRKGEPPALAWAIVLFGMIGGIVGARLWFAFEHWDQVIHAPLAFLLTLAGMVWYGGLLGGVIATLWPIRRAGVAWASAADTAAPALAIGLAIARIGCHLAGDGDWGTPTDLPWQVAYTHGTAPWPHPPGVGVHPAALYETIALTGVFAILWQLRARVQPAGALFAIYLVLASVTRFLIEFIRTNDVRWLGMTDAQWVSLGLVIGAVTWLSRNVQSATSPFGGFFSRQNS